MAFSKRKRRPDDEFPTSVRLSGKLRNFLVDEAQAQDRSLTWIISDILETWMAYKSKERETKEMRIRK